MKVKKYHYDIFLKPLTPLNRIKLIVHKIKSTVHLSNLPHALEIGLTYRCQLNCIHCGVYGQNESSQPELSLDELKDIILQAHIMGVYLVVFSGGEPLIREEVAELVEYAAKKGMITALSTNGQLLTQDVVCKLKDKGIVFINISIDSANHVLHDRCRGVTGCFQKAETAIRKCVFEGISVIISTYATKENIYNGDLKNIINFAKQSGAQGVRILLSVPAGKWLGCSQVMLSEQDKLEIRKLLDPVYVYIEGICNKFTECNAVAKKLFYISPYGEVQPCSFVPVYFGSVRQESLIHIWNRMRTHSFFSQFDGSECIMRDKQFSKYPFSNLKKYGGRLMLRI